MIHQFGENLSHHFSTLIDICVSAIIKVVVLATVRIPNPRYTHDGSFLRSLRLLRFDLERADKSQ